MKLGISFLLLIIVIYVLICGLIVGLILNKGQITIMVFNTVCVKVILFPYDHGSVINK